MKPTLIIVDDVPAIREKLYRLLKDTFDIVGQAEDGEQAVALVKEKKPELVLMDVVMPKMSGIEATKELQRQMPNPPKVVVLSGLKEERVVLQAFEAGVCDDRFKPINEERIKEVLLNLLQSQSKK